MSQYVSDCLSTSSIIGRAPRISFVSGAILCPIKANSEHFALGVPQIISDCRKNLRIDPKISKMIGFAFPISNGSNGFRHFPIVSTIFHHFPLISINDCRGLRMSALHVSFPEVPLFLYVSLCFFIVALLLGTSASKHFNSNVFLGSPFISPSCRFISFFILLYPSIIFYHHSSSFIIFHPLSSSCIHSFPCPFPMSHACPLHFQSAPSPSLPVIAASHPLHGLAFPCASPSLPPPYASHLCYFALLLHFMFHFPIFPQSFSVFCDVLRLRMSPHMSPALSPCFPFISGLSLPTARQNDAKNIQKERCLSA